MRKVDSQLRYWYMLLWLRYYYRLGPKKKFPLTLLESHPHFNADPELMKIDGNDGEYGSLISSLRSYLNSQKDMRVMKKIFDRRDGTPSYPDLIDILLAFLGAFRSSDILTLRSKIPKVYSDVH